MGEDLMPRVKYWRPAKLWYGRIWQWMLHRLFWYETETCDRCGCGYGWMRVWWCKDPKVWELAYEHATGQNRGSAGLLCPRCFERSVRLMGFHCNWEAVTPEREMPRLDLEKPESLSPEAKERVRKRLVKKFGEHFEEASAESKEK
jgi:hypothetical protein